MRISAKYEWNNIKFVVICYIKSKFIIFTTTRKWYKDDLKWVISKGRKLKETSTKKEFDDWFNNDVYKVIDKHLKIQRRIDITQKLYLEGLFYSYNRSDGNGLTGGYITDASKAWEIHKTRLKETEDLLARLAIPDLPAKWLSAKKWLNDNASWLGVFLGVAGLIVTILPFFNGQ